MENIIHITSADFDEVVLNSNKPVIVDFFADWCGPCKALSPLLETIANEYKDKILFVKVNVDEETDIAQEFSVMSIPTLVLIENGDEKDRIVGLTSKDHIISTFGL